MATRHPKQVKSPAEFVRGADYALVFSQQGAGGALAATPATFAGTLYDTTSHSARLAIDRFRGRWGLHLTLHYDCDPDLAVHPNVYGLWWDSPRAPFVVPGFAPAGDSASLLTDPPEALLADGAYAAHRLVVPLTDWEADPRVRADWESAPAGGCWVAEEAKLRVRRDDAMRRALGF